MSWEQTVQSKINDLELIASWAACITGLGRVRDKIREAESLLRDEIERRRQMEEEFSKL